MDRTSRIRQALPDDRQLVPDESADVANECDADAVANITYEDNDGFIAVHALILWFKDRGELYHCTFPPDDSSWSLKTMSCNSMSELETSLRKFREISNATKRGETTLEMENGQTRTLSEERHDKNQ
jgi:hypothetical protein